MEKEIFNLTPISYLAGFHLHVPNYNIKDVKGELYNFITEKTGKPFNIIAIDDGLEISRIANDKNFEIKFESTSLIYQDGNIDYEIFKENALSILQKWQSIYPKAKHLRLAGILRKFEITSEPPKGVYNSRIYDFYLNNFNITGKKKKLSLHLNYSYDKKGLDYNINLNLDEELKKDYSYELRIDVNKLDFDKQMNLDYKKVEETFNFADHYYKEEFFKDINLLVKQ
jgi:hypothetical protein